MFWLFKSDKLDCQRTICDVYNESDLSEFIKFIERCPDNPSIKDGGFECSPEIPLIVQLIKTHHPEANNTLECVEKLIDNGADISSSKWLDMFPITPFFAAINWTYWIQPDMIRLLLEKGIDKEQVKQAIDRIDRHIKKDLQNIGVWDEIIEYIK